MSELSIRKATMADVNIMAEIHMEAFADSALSMRCFPQTDPNAQAHTKGIVERYINDPSSDVLVAETSSGEMAGWIRWDHKRDYSPPTERLIFNPETYPVTGDQKFAASFSQDMYDATHRVMANDTEWLFLSTVVVRNSWQRKGVGSKLIAYGMNEVERHNLPAYTNASPKGKQLYERFGFRSVDSTDSGHGVVTEHMRRAPV